MGRQPSKYINRELSWLEFNQRVLDEAFDESVPLLERVRFLAITASNMDEFFMVRVGGLQMLVEQGIHSRDPSGKRPLEQLRAIRKRARQMVNDQYRCFLEILEPSLKKNGIHRLLLPDVIERQSRDIRKLVESEVYPILTPMAVGWDDDDDEQSTEGRGDFPMLANQTQDLCVRLAPAKGDASKSSRFAIIPLSGQVPRLLTLHSEQNRYDFILLEDALSHCIDMFFPGEVVVECVPFRITRNADMSLQEDQAYDLMHEMEEILDARKESSCVRLEISADASPELLLFLERKLGVDSQDVYAVPGPVALSAFTALADLQEHAGLKHPDWPPQASPQLEAQVSLFETLSRKDLLLYHPYESYEPVVRFIEEAANDPDVLAIKQTLYRTSRKSPVVMALKEAAQKGKHVTAIVELKARFDEARNIAWARDMEQAGVQVIYGVKGLKTHAKICIIVRREPQGMQRYVHFGTGNYNEITSRIYSDVSLMTCNEEFGADATSFFNAISGYSQPLPFRKIAAAPMGLREKLLEMIEIEKEQKRQGRRASITAKFNSLSDTTMINALYEASQAGVKIRLNIRGICCLRPGVPGLSENISVVSIVDRLLEHSRIFHFHHGGDGRLFISSADWMTRNLDRRVELLVPVEDPACRTRLMGILESYFQDTVKARTLMPDGEFKRIKPMGRRRTYRCQEGLYEEAVRAFQEAENSRRSMFEPHKAPED